MGNVFSDLYDQLTDGGQPQYLWPEFLQKYTIKVDTDNKVIDTSPTPGACSPSYLFRSPSMPSVEVRCGVPDYKAVSLRKVPGTPLEVFTPRATFLYVDPLAAPEPKLAWGSPPDTFIKLGMWGNSPLYTSSAYKLSAFSPQLQSIVKNGGQPPAPLDITTIVNKGQDALLTVDPGVIVLTKPAPGGGVIHATFPPNGNNGNAGAAGNGLITITPPHQGGPSQEGGQGGTTTAAASDGPGVGTVLGVLAAIGLGAYAISRMR